MMTDRTAKKNIRIIKVNPHIEPGKPPPTRPAKRQYRYWTPHEIKLLTDNLARGVSVVEIAKHLDRGYEVVLNKMKFLGLEQVKDPTNLPGIDAGYEPILLLPSEGCHDSPYNIVLDSWQIESWQCVVAKSELQSINRGDWIVGRDTRTQDRKRGGWSYGSQVSNRYQCNVAMATNRDLVEYKPDGRIIVEFTNTTAVLFRRSPDGAHTNFWLLRPELDFPAMARMYGKRRNSSKVNDGG